jgi:hypothetical protein
LRTIKYAASAALFIVGCGPQRETGAPNTNTEQDKIVSLRTEVMTAAQQKRDEREKKLRAMDIPQLAGELVQESQKGREPFNSMAFAELISRGENGAATLSSLLTKPEGGSLLGLLALKQMNRTRYTELQQGFRINILVEALKGAKFFNAWGLPHVRWEAAATALIEEGAAAERPLFSLLEDKRAAPVWGSEDFAEYQRYKYRVCDYAWGILREITKTVGAIPESPEERDRLIEEMLKSPSA